LPYTFAVTSGTRPPGAPAFTLAPNSGLLSGTSTTSGTGVFTITATDANGCPGTRDYVMTSAESTGIPTLSTWGLLILMALIGLVSTWYLRRAG